MGRRIRRVPADWVHPVYTEKDARHPEMIGRPRPLFEGRNLDALLAEWDEGQRLWNEGLRPESSGVGEDVWVDPGDREMKYRGKDDTWTAWMGSRPNPANYMPNWPDEERTHIVMYEDTTEGTPISPVFKTGEALARWLADNNASCFGDSTASYETWLGWIRADGVVDSLEDIAEECGERPIWAMK